jgi:hypothetical protein
MIGGMEMKTKRYLGLFSDFDNAFSTVMAIRGGDIPELSVDDVTISSPIEHPEINDFLGKRPERISRLTLAGALFGLIFGFIFLASSQAAFMIQPLGGKPIIPLPNNFVLVYEMIIFFGIWMTFFGFLGMSGLFTNCMKIMTNRPQTLYSERVSLGEIAIIVEVTDEQEQPLVHLFREHESLQVKHEDIT